jgi:hypothetical protein
LGTVGNALRGVPKSGTPRRAFPTVGSLNIITYETLH